MQHLRLTIAAILAAITLVFAGCGGGGESFEVQPSETAPSVAGALQVEEANQSNYQADLSLKYLPLPQNLGEGLSTYVVWVNPQGSDKNVKVGTLRVEEDSRNGNLQFTTPYSNFKVIVTAEQSANVNQPSEPVVVTEQVSMQ